MARKTHDVVATTGEYQSGGETKKRYMNVGAAFTDDQGRISIKLEAVPVGPGWSGWLSLFEPKENNGGQQQQRQPTQQRQEAAQRQQQQPAKDDGRGGGGGSEENIPFSSHDCPFC